MRFIIYVNENCPWRAELETDDNSISSTGFHVTKNQLFQFSFSHLKLLI